MRHLAARARPIVGPDIQGRFQSTTVPGIPPVVIDANVLNRDLMRAARTGERTVLINAANSGILRIFCAQHVLDEVR